MEFELDSILDVLGGKDNERNSEDDEMPYTVGFEMHDCSIFCRWPKKNYPVNATMNWRQKVKNGFVVCSLICKGFMSHWL